MKSNSLLEEQPLTGIFENFKDSTSKRFMKRNLGEIDIAKTKIADAQRLDRVGMSNIECPVMIQLQGMPAQLAPGRADAFVSLDEPQKGIHMSRLFLSLTDALSTKPISPAMVGDISRSFLKSHDGISKSAHVRVNFELMLQRPSLLSENSGWRSYPISIWASSIDAETSHGIDLTVRYSSTCPCSAALARQLIQNKFNADFPPAQAVSREEIIAWLGKEESIAGTPHGQRSEGKVRLLLRNPTQNLDLAIDTVKALEAALATSVQSAVKREDEQEFARLNASNLMFAEDAVRRMSAAVRSNVLFTGTSCEVSHFESLHPHDAVAKVATGELIGRDWN